MQKGYKMKLLIIILSVAMSGCSCVSVDTAFGMDGKAVSWCERKHRAEKLCRKHNGLKDYYYEYAECNDGTKFTDEVEK